MKLKQLLESKELATELLWFRRFISENDLETEIEVEGNKLVVYQDGKNIGKWNATDANRIRTDILTNAFESRWYAEYCVHGRFELGESAIATNPGQSYRYALTNKMRFKLGEPGIATVLSIAKLYKKFLEDNQFDSTEFMKLLTPAIKASLRKLDFHLTI